jgi:hypothetical protein
MTRTHQQNVNTKVENVEENHDCNRQLAAEIENHRTDDKNENSVATIMADDGESVASFEYDSDPLTHSASPQIKGKMSPLMKIHPQMDGR